MKKSIIGIACAVAALILAFGIYSYADNYNNSKDEYMSGTKLNGVDCSGMTAEEASVALSEDRNSMQIEVSENGEQLTTIKDMNITFDIGDELSNALHGSVTRLYIPVVTDMQKNLSFDMKIAELPDKSIKNIKSNDFLENNYKVKTKNAYVDLSDFDFDIVEEVYGDNVDKNRFVEKVKECYEKGEDEIAYKPADYYQLPTVKSDSEELLEYQSDCKKFLSCKITYNFYDEDVTLTPDILVKMINFDSGSVEVDEDAVYDEVLNLAYEHNTVGTTRTIRSATGSTIEVSGGTYGYAIDLDKETEQLSSDLKAQKDTEREPEYASRPYVSGKDEIGNTFIEVDISAQKTYLVKNGETVLSTSVVTGNVSEGHDTKLGIYQIAYLDREATLRGANADGTDYESEVEYWMPFNSGQGFHDADWRDEFGGEIYLKNGSHGCVNMPPAAAKQLFNNIEAGYPVIVHN